MDGITYKTRYQAEKARKANPYISSASVIVKVCGGYVIMSPRDYEIWKKQK